MYTSEQIEGLSWHPLRDVGRGGNYALSTLGRDPGGRVRYLMACGHRSVAFHTRCERGCMEAPNYRTPYVYHEDFKLHQKYYDRKPVGRKVA